MLTLINRFDKIKTNSLHTTDGTWWQY